MANNQIIFSPKLAKILLNKGYKINNIAPNHNSPERTVYYFQDTEGLTEEIEIFMNGQRVKRQIKEAV